MLDGGECLAPGQANITHVTDVEDAHAGAHRIVLSDNAARRRIFDGHIPAIEIHHLRAHLAMDGVKRSLANGWRGRRNSGQ